MYKVEIPDDLPVLEAIHSLPAEWRSDVSYTQALGDRACMARDAAVLVVPSVIVEMDRNILLIGSHAGNARIRVVDEHPMELDRRLFD